MNEILNQKGYLHVLSDVFANDTSIPDPDWISNFILKRANPGSILLIHMPEKGVREWNLEAMRMTLDALLRCNLDVVNLTELQNRL